MSDSNMKNYDNHIQFAEDVINRSQLPESKRGSLNQLIQRIKQRQNDPCLYLAVIGEFSSGKSTFINALLRDNLLKTSALVTTAAATRLSYGKNIDVKVNFANVPSIFQKRTNINIDSSFLIIPIILLIITFIFQPPAIIVTILTALILSISVAIFSDKQNDSQKTVTSQVLMENSIEIRDFINQVTSEEKIAKQVIDININHPATFLQNNIVIIDLPGTNASNERHAKVTREVVEKEADAAIIIIPATQPLTESLTEFLRVTISSYLNRCIFIVSRMDQIRQREHNRMLSNVRKRLVERLEINPTELYWCSAQAVMDDVTGEQPSGNNSEFWSDQFAQMQVEIIQRLQSERTAIISENIQRLFSQLFEQMKNNLQAQWTEYRQREAQLQAETIQDLESFKHEQYRQCIRMIDTAINKTENKINDYIESCRDRTISKVRDAVFDASDWDKLKYVVNTKVVTIVQEQQNSLSGKIQSECHNLSQSAQEAGQYFDKKFTEVYRSLRVLGGRVKNQSAFSSSSISINTSSVVASAKELNSSNFSNAIAGFFSHFFPGLLDSRKQEIWDEIRPQIYDYFSKIKKQVQPTVRKDAENIKNAINQKINAYISNYKSVVDGMLNEQKTELQRLTKLQATIQADLAEIERRRLQIRVNLN
jgi:GTPase Era involved in 16S rRNA processing